MKRGARGLQVALNRRVEGDGPQKKKAKRSPLAEYRRPRGTPMGLLDRDMFGYINRFLSLADQKSFALTNGWIRARILQGWAQTATWLVNGLPRFKAYCTRLGPRPQRIKIAYRGDQGELPESIRYLSMCDDYNTKFQSLPARLTRLTLGHFYDHPLPDPLPQGLTHLTLGYVYDLPLPDSLPQGLTHLDLGWRYTQPLPDSLPQGLTHLDLGWRYTQPLPSPLPHGLTHLTLGERYNQPLPDPLPPGLTHLTLGSDYNQPLPNPLPQGLTHLTLGWNYRRPLPNPLPGGLTLLTLGYYYNQPLPPLPVALAYLTVGPNQSLPPLPPGVTLVVRE